MTELRSGTVKVPSGGTPIKVVEWRRGPQPFMVRLRVVGTVRVGNQDVTPNNGLYLQTQRGNEFVIYVPAADTQNPATEAIYAAEVENNASSVDYFIDPTAGSTEVPR